MKTTLAAAIIILGATITAGCANNGVSVTASAATGEAGAGRTERGKYLVNMTGCSDCHTPFKMGPQGPSPTWSVSSRDTPNRSVRFRRQH